MTTKRSCPCCGAEPSQIPGETWGCGSYGDYKEGSPWRHSSCHIRELKQLKASMQEALKDLEDNAVEANREIVILQETFRHIHVAGDDDDIDKCGQCGLDLRDRVHQRIALNKETSDDD